MTTPHLDAETLERAARLVEQCGGACAVVRGDEYENFGPLTHLPKATATVIANLIRALATEPTDDEVDAALAAGKVVSVTREGTRIGEQATPSALPAAGVDETALKVLEEARDLIRSTRAIETDARRSVLVNTKRARATLARIEAILSAPPPQSEYVTVPREVLQSIRLAATTGKLTTLGYENALKEVRRLVQTALASAPAGGNCETSSAQAGNSSTGKPTPCREQGEG